MTTIWCTNFDLSIGTNGQVTLWQYDDDYLVYEFWSSNSTAEQHSPCQAWRAMVFLWRLARLHVSLPARMCRVSKVEGSGLELCIRQFGPWPLHVWECEENVQEKCLSRQFGWHSIWWCYKTTTSDRSTGRSAKKEKDKKAKRVLGGRGFASCMFKLRP